jgi:dTMP kinase
VRRGGLIVLEGAEGVGKTTQLRRLVERLGRAGIAHRAVREPGGTAIGDEIRRCLLDPAMSITPRAEALLFMASRAQLVDEVVRPALAAGEFVVLDRFFLSTYAYQVHGRELAEGAVSGVNAFATAGVIPELTLLLDLPEGVGLARAAERGEHDRMEQSGAAFHRRVTSAFRVFSTAEWQGTHPEAGEIALIDAQGSEDEVADRIWTRIAARWPETFRGKPESH